MRHRYGRNNRDSSSILKILILFAMLTTFGGVFSFIEDIFILLAGAAGVILSLATLACFLGAPFLIGYGIFKAFFGKEKNNNKTTKKAKVKSASIDNEALLKKLSQYFENNEVIHIDEETYLTITDKENISLKTIDIYMREEYIGSLQDYLTAYPNAYNQLADMLSQYLTKKAKEAKKKAKNVESSETNVAIQKKGETKEVEKDAEYYINTLMKLNDQNPNQQITAGLNETCEFLRSIKKIEDEYPDSKTKTVKLYQYYLPMLADILANYNRLYETTANQADFKASEDRLLKTIVLINGALKTISSGLLEDYYSEINVDMRTLESILKKDGLVEDFKQEG